MTIPPGSMKSFLSAFRSKRVPPSRRAADADPLQQTVKRLRTRVQRLAARNAVLARRIDARDERIRQLERQAERHRDSARAQLERATGTHYVHLLLELTGHPRVTPSQLRRIESELGNASLDDVRQLFPADPLLSNFVLNIWEWAHGQKQLGSLPWNVSLPISDVCNARCSFCTSWLDGQRQLTLEQLEHFEPVLRTAVYVGLVGHGEPLSHPRLGDIADRLSEILDPRAVTYTITNGVYLPRWLPRLDRLRLSTLSCSLNAATPETHQTVMGFSPDTFPRVVDSLRALAAGEATTHPVAVSVTLVVTRQNIHEIPAFIELGNEIKATSIYLRTLLPQGDVIPGLNYQDLPPYLHPDFKALHANAVAAMHASSVPVFGEPETWGSPVFPSAFERSMARAPLALIPRAEALRDKEARASRSRAYRMEDAPTLRGEPNDVPWLADRLKDASNPLGRTAPFRCRAVYNNLYVNELFLRVAPCCYLVNTPGHDEIRLTDTSGLAEAWNATALQELRRRLAQGPLYGACERCPETW